VPFPDLGAGRDDFLKNDFPRQLDRAVNSSNFSVNVVLPASGCKIIAKVRRRKISSVRGAH
jgi:hypothetical protein